MSPRGWARTDAASTRGVEQSLMERWCWGLASRRGGNAGEAGPLKGALSMLRGGLHVWSPRTQHPRDMGVAWMRGGGASRGLRHGYRPPFDGAVTQRQTRGRHSGMAFTRRPVSPRTYLRQTPRAFPSRPQHRPLEVLAAPAPGRQRLAPALLAGARLGGRPGPCTKWLPRASYSETCPLGELGVLGLVWESSGFNPGSCVNSVYALLS